LPSFVAAARRPAPRVAGLLALLAGCAMSEPGTAPATDGPPTLPASFAGTLPCAGSAGGRAQLDLWPDGVFHLQRTCLGTPDRDDDRGRWQLTPDGDGIRLHGGREMPLAFAWRGRDALVPLDVQGRPVGDGESGLRRLPDFAPADLQLALHGMFRYLADAAGFEECLTGRTYPVAMEGDFVALERAYMASEAGGTGTPIMASFDGEIADRPAMEGGGATATVIVRRFVNLWPGGRCERAMSRASLAETYWKLVRLRGEPVVTLPRQREAHLILRSVADRYKGSFGCFRYDGQYRVNGAEIAFDAPRWTAEDACTSSDPNSASPPRSEYSDALGAVHRWAINAQVLEWFDATGASVALFEAVYLR
jgi:copper homeostasis protein (lipoprotein)